MPTTAARLTAVALLAISLPAAVAYAQTAGKGSIEGKVFEPASDELTDELLRDRTLTRYEMHTHSTEGVVPPYTLSEKAVVYVETAPAGYGLRDTSGVHPKLNQQQMLFRPLVLPVLVGTTVDFPNNDDLFHNVFSYSQPKEFDLGRYPRGHVRSVRFDKPGVVKVYCDIHSYMYASILVLDNPYFTVPNADGDYSIGDVPAGTYKLCLWYGRKKVATKTVVVSPGAATTVNFEF